MPSLDQIEQAVNELDEDNSSPFAFRDVLDTIERTAKITSNTEVSQLRDIVSSFREKLPSLMILNPVRSRAKDLAEALMLQTLSERIDRMNARNEALTDLTVQLDVQIHKANSDAGLLSQIKDMVNKATATVEEVKSLIGELSETQGSVKAILVALVNALANISSIFEAQPA